MGVKKMMLPSFVGVSYMVVVAMNESKSSQNDTFTKCNGALQVETSKTHELHLHKLLVGVQGRAQVGEYV
jgi:hypothetical protein